MPKIKTPIPSADPGGTALRIADPGVQQIGVPRAKPQRIFDPGKGILAKALGDVGKAVEDVAGYYAKKEELLRQSISQQIQINIADEFLERAKDWKNRKGSQAAGLLEDEGYHYGAYKDLKIKYLTDDLDPRTRKEVQKALDTQFLRERQALIGHTISQADIANKQIAERHLTNAYSYINTLNATAPDYLDDIVAKAKELTEAHILRNPELNKEQLLKGYTEELLYHGMLKSFVDNPVAATKLWEEQKEYFKLMLPTKYDNLAIKYKTAKDDAQYDIADQMLKMEYNNNYSAMAQAVAKNPEKYELHADDALTLSQKYIGLHNHQISETKRIRQEQEEKILDKLDEAWRDSDTGIINLTGYLDNLEQEYRKGNVDKITRDSTRAWAMTGELSREDYFAIQDDIDNNIITTKEQIRHRIAGRNTKAIPFLYSQLEKTQADALKGLGENQLNAAEQTFIRMASDQRVKESDRPNPANANAFKNYLRAWAIQQGYSSRDTRIHDEAVKLLDRGWYYKFKAGVTEDQPFIEGAPDVWDRLAAWGPSREVQKVFRWQYEAEHGRPELSEIATSVDPKTEEAIRWVLKYYPNIDIYDPETIKRIVKRYEETKTIPPK